MEKEQKITKAELARIKREEKLEAERERIEAEGLPHFIYQ